MEESQDCDAWIEEISTIERDHLKGPGQEKSKLLLRAIGEGAFQKKRVFTGIESAERIWRT